MPEIDKEAQQITVGIGDDKLSMPIFDLVLPIPSLFERNDDFAPSGFDAPVQLLDFGYFNHEVDPAAVGIFERRCTKAPAGPFGWHRQLNL